MPRPRIYQNSTEKKRLHARKKVKHLKRLTETVQQLLFFSFEYYFKNFERFMWLESFDNTEYLFFNFKKTIIDHCTLAEGETLQDNSLLELYRFPNAKDYEDLEFYSISYFIRYNRNEYRNLIPSLIEQVIEFILSYD